MWVLKKKGLAVDSEVFSSLLLACQQTYFARRYTTSQAKKACCRGHWYALLSALGFQCDFWGEPVFCLTHLRFG